MRHTNNIMAFLLLSISIVSSCNKVEEVLSGRLLPGEFLVDNSLVLSAEVSSPGMDGIIFSLSGDRTVAGNSNWSFVIGLNDEKELAYRDYLSERTAKINQFIEDNPGVPGPHLYDCGISEPVKLVSDVKLFGREPGSNLSDLCSLVRIDAYNTVLCTWPGLEVIRNTPQSGKIAFDDYFAVGNAFFSLMDLRFVFNNAPDEQPDSVTLTIEIPLQCSYWYGKPWAQNLVHRGDSPIELPEYRKLITSVEVNLR